MCIQLPDQLMPAPSAPQNGESAASVMPPDQPTSTGITPEHLKSALRTRIEAEHVEIADLSGAHPNPLPLWTQPRHARAESHPD